MKTTKICIITLLLSCVFALSAQTKYPQVVISTNYGDMTVMLYDETPRHAAYFLDLVKKNYFDGTLFQRVIKEFMIQGGAQDTRNAPAGARVGSGNTSMEIMPEFNEKYFHKKGVLSAPRRGDNENPQKKSDMSQIFIVHGKVLTEGRLDSMEMAVNVPIKNAATRKYYIPYKEQLAELKANDPQAFNDRLDEIMFQIDSAFTASPNKFFFDPAEKEAYSTIGGARHLNMEYTAYGEVIEGLEVIDKIANLAVDGNDRPKQDAKIIKVYIKK
ncbi:MAG: peptidylprolyl isomerase [Bacteroidales bacterium]|jgi:peptidyl-prolyl cis-trans isomerase B (cyclophilin B)|nr:peptidylprolyl isomerase [Bacteroidales bacterium]